MLGNDIVDIAVARKESNWKRKGFLDKIFTQNEQLLVQRATNPASTVWNLWSRKEAAYKIYNRETGIRGFFPLQIECSYHDENWGDVSIKGSTYFTKTSISVDYIYTIAVSKKDYFSLIEKIDCKDAILKSNGIPFIFCQKSMTLKPVSISHHGAFWRAITINSLEYFI